MADLLEVSHQTSWSSRGLCSCATWVAFDHEAGAGEHQLQREVVVGFTLESAQVPDDLAIRVLTCQRQLDHPVIGYGPAHDFPVRPGDQRLSVHKTGDETHAEEVEDLAFGEGSSHG